MELSIVPLCQGQVKSERQSQTKSISGQMHTVHTGGEDSATITRGSATLREGFGSMIELQRLIRDATVISKERLIPMHWQTAWTQFCSQRVDSETSIQTTKRLNQRLFAPVDRKERDFSLEFAYSPRGGPDRAIGKNNLAILYLNLNNVPREISELFRAAEPGWIRRWGAKLN